jgi:hypothetical protein
MARVYQNTFVRFLLKLMAFLFPLFFIYGSFDSDEYNGLADQLWRFMVGGLLFDLAILVILLQFFI